MDNIPIICAAGNVNKSIPETTANLMKLYKDHDLAEEIVQNENRNIRKNVGENLISEVELKRKIDNEESVKNLIEPLLRKFRFKIFEEEFFENLYYQSSKNPLGKSMKCLSKPDHITNISQTFGRVTKRATDPILPTKDYNDIMKESLIGHDNYLVSHNSYFPSERINRKYDRNVFNPNMVFGKKISGDILGGNVKRIMKSCEDSFCIINTVQDNKLKKEHAVLSKTKPKQDLNLDPNYICGRPQRPDKIRGKMLLQNLPQCPKLLELYKSISYLNSKRLQLKKKDFPFHEVEVSLKLHDPLKNGYLDWALVFNILHQHYLLLDIEKIKPSLMYFEATDTNAEKVHYDKLMKLIMASYPLPQLTNLIKLPKTDPVTLTTYRELTTDRIRYPSTCEQYEEDHIAEYPKSGLAQCRADLENLGSETDMGSVLSPTIAFQYGLSHRDYLIPRTQDEIREIFEIFLKNVDEEMFLDMWNEAITLISSRDNLVSIEAFKFVLNKIRNKR